MQVVGVGTIEICVLRKLMVPTRVRAPISGTVAFLTKAVLMSVPTSSAKRLVIELRPSANSSV